MKRPDPSEYAAYYGKYIEKVPDGPIVDILRAQIRGTLELLRSVPESKGDHTYAVFGYRALRFGRSDATQLPGFEQDDYVRAAGFSARSMRHLADELETVRRGTVLLYEGFGEGDWSRKGIASSNPVSVRGLAYIIAGHELHHVKILKEQYLR